MKKAHEILTEARSLIERGWIQKMAACDRYGESVDVSDPTACKWCVVGAVWRTGGDAEGNANIELDIAMNALYFSIPYIEDVNENFYVEEISYYNDDKETTKQRVLWWIDDAIERC